MGAVTALMYGMSDPSVGALVLDSPFYSLNKLVKEIAKQKVNVPNFVVSSVMSFVSSSVQERANFKIKDVKPKNFAKSCFIPALFIHGKEDDFIGQHHSEKLHDLYGGDKNIILVDGNHNSKRPGYSNDSAVIHLYNALQLEDLKQKKNEKKEEEEEEVLVDEESEDDEMVKEAIRLSMLEF